MFTSAPYNITVETRILVARVAIAQIYSEFFLVEVKYT